MEKTDERTCNPVPVEELERRWSAARSLMRGEGIDALLAQGANNLTGMGGYFRWLTGIAPVGSYAQTAIFPREDLMTLIHHGDFDGQADSGGSDPAFPGVGRRFTMPQFPAIAYTAEYDAEIAAREIRKAGIGTLGIVGGATAYHGFAARLRTLLSGMRIVDATPGLDDIKAVKSPWDIEQIRRAAAMQDAMFEKARAFVKPGMKDYEVSARSHYDGQLLGSETGYMLGSSAPPDRPALLRQRPQHAREIRAGDILMWQAENTGPGGFFVHLARPIVFGRTPQAIADAFGAACEAQDYTLGLLKAGVACRDIFEAYNAYMRSRGLPAERRLHCHGQGYENVERPLVRNDESMRIRAGMNIGIHPVVSNQRMFMTVCDNFLVRADAAPERLHRTPRAVVEL